MFVLERVKMLGVSTGYYCFRSLEHIVSNLVQPIEEAKSSSPSFEYRSRRSPAPRSVAGEKSKMLQ